MAKKDKNKKERTDEFVSCRLGKVGGQAVIEGIMMKSGDDMAIASRMPDDSIKITKDKFVSVRKKHKALNIPILRGIINFVESLVLSFKTLNISTQALGLDEEEEMTRFEKWLMKKFGKSIMTFVMVLSTILGVLLAVFLFTVLPTASISGLDWIVAKLGVGEISSYAGSVIEGFLKIVIFLVYMALVSLMPDIKRTFQYHGAEHKSIFCYEKGLDLTVENVKKQSRFHPRCGTSFMFFMILISIIIGLFLPWDNKLLRVGLKLLLLPLSVGVGFEVIMLAGKHPNFITKAISAPGLWVQRLTTKEPDEKQIECAIHALKTVLPDDFPEFAQEQAEKEKAEKECADGKAECAEDEKSENS